MSKHTPGPWVVRKAEDLHGYSHFVMTPNGFLGYLPKNSEGGGAQLFIKADANLIAAAPDMMELLEHPLLQRMLGDIEDLQTEETAHIWALAVQWMELRDLLIAKATGESE